jgi:hypothetical protein
LLNGINDGTCRATTSPEYFVDEKLVNIFEKLVDVPEDPAMQISTAKIHGVQTGLQLYVRWQTTHMHQTSVKVRVSVFSSESAEKKVGGH